MQVEQLHDAAGRLYEHLSRRHWNGSMLVGPDPGIRYDARIGRFVKSYLPALPWADDMTYMQAQGYWIFDNWLLADTEPTDTHREIAIGCSRAILDAQHDDGHWTYPNPEWRGRVATVEGCFASLALLETYRRTGTQAFLDGAVRWYEYTEHEVGFRSDRAGVAINYFAGPPAEGGGVPNNSTLYLWFIALLAQQTGDPSYLARADSRVSWLIDVQLPYAHSAEPGRDRIHFLCYQYNAFEFMDLVHYRELTGNDSVVPILEPLAGYLTNGLTTAGAARYSCLSDVPTVAYYAAAIGQALSQATGLGYGDNRHLVDQAYAWVLDRQQADGNFAFYSTRNHRILSDRRSYPRYLTMILHHLLLEQRRLDRTPQDADHK